MSIERDAAGNFYCTICGHLVADHTAEQLKSCAPENVIEDSARGVVIAIDTAEVRCAGAGTSSNAAVAGYVVKAAHPESTPPTVDQLVREFGEDRRKLITVALAWLDEHESKWGDELDRREFVRDLVNSASELKVNP